MLHTGLGAGVWCQQVQGSGLQGVSREPHTPELKNIPYIIKVRLLKFKAYYSLMKGPLGPSGPSACVSWALMKASKAPKLQCCPNVSKCLPFARLGV